MPVTVIDKNRGGALVPLIFGRFRGRGANTSGRSPGGLQRQPRTGRRGARRPTARFVAVSNRVKSAAILRDTNRIAATSARDAPRGTAADE